MIRNQHITEKSKLEGKLEVVLASFDDRLEVARISKITGLSETEVVRILKDHKKNLSALPFPK